MRGVADTSAIVVILTIEVGDIVVALIEVETEIAPASRACQQAGKHIVFTRGRFARIANLSSLLLYMFPCFFIDNRGVGTFKNHLVFHRILMTSFILIRLGIGLKINYIAAIFL